MNIKPYIKDLSMLNRYMGYWIEHYGRHPISFQTFKEKQIRIRQTEIEHQKNRSKKKFCYYCHTPLKGEETIDHIVPMSRGGKNVSDNRVFCCSRCNGLKRDLTLSQFLKMLQREQKKKGKISEKHKLDDKSLCVMVGSVKKLIAHKSPIIHKISEYGSMI